MKNDELKEKITQKEFEREKEIIKAYITKQTQTTNEIVNHCDPERVAELLATLTLNIDDLNYHLTD